MVTVSGTINRMHVVQGVLFLQCDDHFLADCEYIPLYCNIAAFIHFDTNSHGIQRACIFFGINMELILVGQFISGLC